MVRNEINGTLADFQILEYCESGKLIIDNFRKENIKQACYELRASNIYHDLSSGNKKYELVAGEYILIKPKQLIVIIVKEKLELPKDILGRILIKGSLFSIGLIPVNTYADPGFEGHLGLVINNSSNNYIKINVDENIAKIEFSKLQFAVKKDYKGQHGYSTNEWVIKESNILTEEEIKNDKRIESEFDDIKGAYGSIISNSLSTVFRYQRKLSFMTVAYSILVMIIVTYMICKSGNPNIMLSSILSFVIGIITSVVFTIFMNNVTKINKKRSR
ncbi:hypothetical protein [Clostridium sp. YIM B02506]|jgi:dCTP deaminase|uniref:dCTP deaminase domain-containing protein n=1 Tax=Clostridium sp. YIM B02506 TaxID=2910680 RepID=UPI001EEDA7BC|nr:hypothetical protein [Clostridium sp. YIM B02506]